MSYIWNNYSDNNRYVLSDNRNNFGTEIVGINQNTFQVNVLIRLYDVFFPNDFVNSENSLKTLMDKYLYDPVYIDIFNIISHVHAFFDINSGMTTQDLISICIDKQIWDGDFGKKIRELYSLCDKKIRYHLLNYYSKMMLSKGTSESFECYIETVFKEVNQYYDNETNTSIIYIHKEKNEVNLAAVELALFFLCRISRNVVVLWKGEHMPIIGEDYSMIIDDMCLSF